MAELVQLSNDGLRLVETLADLRRDISPDDNLHVPAVETHRRKLHNISTSLRQWSSNVRGLNQGSIDLESLRMTFHDLSQAIGETTDIIRRDEGAAVSAQLGMAVERIQRRMNQLNLNTVPTITRQEVDEIQNRNLDGQAATHERWVYFFFQRLHANTDPSHRQATFSPGQQSTTCVDFGSLNFFWDAMPKHKDLPPGSVNFSNNPNGFVFEERHINKATDQLKAFCDAWRQLDHRDADETGLKKLEKMSKIVLILSIIEHGRKGLIGFIRDEGDEIKLPVRHRADLVQIFGGLNNIGIDLSTMFYAQQYRVVKREWKEGQHIDCVPREPLRILTLRVLSEIGQNYRATVEKVKDVTDQQVYACKTLRFENGGDEAYENERKVVKEVLANGGHRHIVKFIKTFQREDELGFIMLPAADSNLSNLMDTYCTVPTEQLNARPGLLIAFGCLSSGLRHLHNLVSVRHKDIKPGNILYYKNMDIGRSTTERVQFFWTDFGASTKFDPKDKSYSCSPAAIGTLAYQAPEIETEEAHGRATDIYSFGCTLLEVISTLIYGAYKATQKNGFQQFCRRWNEKKQKYEEISYKDEPDKIADWIHKTKEVAAGGKMQWKSAIAKILKLVSEMIEKDAEKRPSISKILLKLKKIDEECNTRLFCTECGSSVQHTKDQLRQEDIDYRKNHTSNIIHKGILQTKSKLVIGDRD